jgi:DNA-directed RNA polymerase subunit RPC12/RpoP
MLPKAKYLRYAGGVGKPYRSGFTSKLQEPRTDEGQSMIRCPRCERRDIHRSSAKSFGEKLGLTLILRKPVRCYECSFRFTTWIFRRVKPRIGGYGQKSKTVAA